MTGLRLIAQPQHPRAARQIDHETGSRTVSTAPPIAMAAIAGVTGLVAAQHRQEFDGTLMHRQRSCHVQGSIEGNTLRTMAGSAGELVLQLRGGRLQIVTAEGPLALVQGMGFRRAAGGRCG